jgi:hypothetical protein
MPCGGRPPKRYRADARNGMATLNPVALADRIRSLAVQNDPDALRAGLIAIAAELENWTRRAVHNEHLRTHRFRRYH